MRNIEEWFLEPFFYFRYYKEGGDLECDAEKKLLVRDLDGSFLGDGEPASIIPHAGLSWGDSTTGLGDWLLPGAMVQDWNGENMPLETVRPYMGEFLTDY